MVKIGSVKPHEEFCKCFVCGNNRPFHLPNELLEKFEAGEIVIFAGAGVSTETRNVFPYSLYEDVCHELQVSSHDGISFPEVMSQYCARSNGRALLLRKIRDRFEYIRSFPELYRAATRFHRELSTLSVVENIVTTNWDYYFERECGAIPLVTAEDFAFWNLPGRKVFKIHGSVDSYGSIVATREDYEVCHQRLTTGLLGSNLRLMLATKTVVYLGFSFRDDDFTKLYDALVAEMKGLAPQGYIVTLDTTSDDRFREKGLVPIFTDATYFVSEVKKRLVAREQLVDDERFDGVARFLKRVRQVHCKVSDIDPRKYPDVIFCLSYQDGMIHALERVLAMRDTGYYSHPCNVHNAYRVYNDRILGEKRKKRRFHDVAYVEGYIDGLTYFIADDSIRRQVPMYFAFGERHIIRNLDDYRHSLRRASRLAPLEHKFAKKLVDRRSPGEAMVLHHTPFLL